MNQYQLAKKEYKDGNRKPEFMFQYTYILDRQGDLDSGAVVGEYLATQSNKELMTAKNIGYIYDFLFYDNIFYIGHNSNAFRLMYDNKKDFARYFNMNQIDARIILTLYSEIQKSYKNGGKDFEELYELIKVYHGRRNISIEDPDRKRQAYMIHEIDSNAIRSGYNNMVLRK